MKPVIVHIDGRDIELPPDLAAEWAAKGEKLMALGCVHCGSRPVERGKGQAHVDDDGNLTLSMIPLCDRCFVNVEIGWDD